MGVLTVLFGDDGWRKVHRDQLVSLARATPLSMIGYTVNIALAVVAFWTVIPSNQLLGWAAASLAICAFVGVRSVRGRTRSRSDARPSKDSPVRGGGWAIAFAVMLALPWAILPLGWVGHLDGTKEVILITLAVGMAASGAVLLSPIPLAGLIYVATILVPLFIRSVYLGGDYIILGALDISYQAFLFGVIITKAQLFKERLEAIAKLEMMVAALSESREETHRAAMTDGLTGLANRRAFVGRLGELDAAKTSYSIFYVDLDRFKPVNDTLGHAVGDGVLAAASIRIAGLVRPTDLVARLGGDEFAIVALGSMDRSAASLMAERLRHALAWPFAIDGRRIEIGCSIGVAIPNGEAATGEDLLKQADLAMYAAKDMGRGSFCIFEPDMQRSIEERQSIETGLALAIDNKELELFFQPIRKLATDAITGFECLIRWNHPKRGMLLPAQFLGVANEMGMADEIAEWVLDNACRQAATWPSTFVVTINTSLLQIASHDIVAKVERALKTSGLAASQLEIQFTESSLLQSSEATLASLRTLRSLGVSIVLDDFGTGLSSLSYLVNFPFNRIKIDRLFVSQLGRCRESDLIVRSIAQLAKNLHCTVVAEGVETGDQYRRLRALHVSHGQGNLLGEPLRAAEVLGAIGAQDQKATPIVAPPLERQSA